MGCNGSNALTLRLHEGMKSGEAHLLVGLARCLPTQDARNSAAHLFLHAPGMSLKKAVPVHVLSASEELVHGLSENTDKHLADSVAWSIMTLSAMACTIPAVHFRSCSRPQRAGSSQA